MGDKYDIETGDLRELILRRMKDLGLSNYDVAEARGLGLSPATVYRYLAGDDSLSGNVSKIMRVVGLRIVATRSKPKVCKRS